VAAGRETLGVEIGVSAELCDSLGYTIGVALFVVGMLQKLLRYGLSMYPRGHEVMSLVSKNADNFGRQSLVQDCNDFFAIRQISGSYGTLIDVLPGSAS
jgi:hypothetical protein